MMPELMSHDPASSEPLKSAIDEIHRLRRECDRIMELEPDADRHTVWHTLVCLSKPPIERLRSSLIRGRGFMAYRNRTDLP
jgi:hypothetical protein